MKITCDVIEDLLPLYVDDVASGDSKALVEEHLEECERCQRTLADMREGIDIPTDKEEQGMDDKMIILHLKKKIMKRIAAVIAVAAVLVVTVCVWNYFYYDFNVYVDYEDSGVYVEHGLLFEPIYVNGEHSLLSPDGKVQFFYVVDSPFTDNKSAFDDKKALLSDAINASFGDELRYYRVIQNMNEPWPEGAEAIISDEEQADRLREEGVTNFAFMPETPTHTSVERLYYLAKDQRKNVREAWEADSRGDKAEAERLIRLAQENSVLLWERDKEE